MVVLPGERGACWVEPREEVEPLIKVAGGGHEGTRQGSGKVHAWVSVWYASASSACPYLTQEHIYACRHA